MYNIPKYVIAVIALIQSEGYEAYLVGGCARDILLGLTPNDWDITTNATPDKIQAIFPHTFYENTFGTVSVVIDKTTEEEERIVQVTPYRTEGGYSDGRHPGFVSWETDITKDLARRDFTMNAIAYDPIHNEWVDPFEGTKDIGDKQIRAVGDPLERFEEDSLRLMRAVRFTGQLGFNLEENTRKALITKSETLARVSRERVRDELIKIMMFDDALPTINLLKDTGLMKHIIPELLDGVGCEQNQAHSFDVWEHNLRTCNHACFKKHTLVGRLAALLHDVSKPETRRYSKEKRDYTFYGHDVVGGRVSREILKRLKFPKETVDTVSMLVRWHMFFSDTEQITLSAVRRLITNVGKEHIWDLIELRKCDRIGTGRPKEQPYRFRLYQSMIEQALTDPISLKMLKIDGLGIMDATKLVPGPKIGLILHALFSDILDDPTKNTEDWLREQARAYAALSDKELTDKGESGKHDMKDTQAKQIEKIRKEFKVK